jgi:hypothetical protein
MLGTYLAEVVWKILFMTIPFDLGRRCPGFQPGFLTRSMERLAWNIQL